MKKMHLVCGTHIDPAWLWDWRDGAATAISTFRVATQFCEEYDGYVFCHNEALLYMWVEENEPELFKKIQKLVKEKKWHIMGGWYNQPDCLQPTGESIIRQIRVGKNYFMEKFGVSPTTAANFDSFGHSRGLVQILKKCGYDSYMCMRAENINSGDFIWRGFDGSDVIGQKLYGAYSTAYGKALNKITGLIDNCDPSCETVLCMWGVGNHGGGASRVDLDAIAEYQNKSEVEIIHSTPEAYFSEVVPDNLNVIDQSLTHCMVGCYTSMLRIKQKHRRLESLLGRAEKMLVHSGVDFDEKLIKMAEEKLLFNEFHDILPGTCIKTVEEDSLAALGFAEDVAEQAATKAFFALCAGQKKARDGEIPIMVYNPQPYPVDTEIEVEFQLANQNWNDEENTVAVVYDEEGNRLPSQLIKEESSLNLDWRKRVTFRAKLQPMKLNRFDAKLSKVDVPNRKEAYSFSIEPCHENDSEIVFENERMNIAISKKTGLITKYEVDGKKLLDENSGEIGVFADSEDPWGMLVDSYNTKIGNFKLLSDAEANAFRGYPNEKMANVSVIENGEVHTKVEAVFSYNKSYAVVTYTIYKKDVYIDLDYQLFINDGLKMFKLQLPTTINDGRFLGQTVFGHEENIQDHKEVVFQKWCGIEKDGCGVCVLTRGTSGGDAGNGELRLSLLHTPIYSAHPLPERPTTLHNRFNSYIDLGERHISLRILPYTDEIDAMAEQYNEPVYALSFFPSGDGKPSSHIFSVDDKHIILSALRKDANGLLIRLYNGSETKRNVSVMVFGKKYEIDFEKFEVKTFVYQNEELIETDMLGLNRM